MSTIDSPKRTGFTSVVVFATGCAVVLGVLLLFGFAPVALFDVLGWLHIVGGIVLLIGVPIALYWLYGFLSPFLVIAVAVVGTIALSYVLGPWEYVLLLMLWPGVVVLSLVAGGIEYAVSKSV